MEQSSADVRPVRGPINRYFAFTAKRSITERWLLHLLLIVILFFAVSELLKFDDQFSQESPSAGGTLTEGIVGTPRFVNPVLAITRADQDMSALVYSGLMRLGADGELELDIARNITTTDAGRTYNVQLREDVYFHDGTQLTASDVAYTITLIQNPDLKSPLRGNWDGVLVEQLGEFELNIVLEEVYAPFIENLTVGILPRDNWDELPIEQLPFSQNNTQPVGTGPYTITDVTRNQSGLIDSYTLSAADTYRGTANISTIIFTFYTNEEELVDALKTGAVMSSAGVSAEALAQLDITESNLFTSPLPRTFALYINQNKSAALREASVREALQAAIDREALISDVLAGFGFAAETPVPPSYIETPTATTSELTDPLTKARGILTADDWFLNDDGRWQKEIGEDEFIELQIVLNTANTPLFGNTAEYVAEIWRTLGADVTVAQFEQADLVQAIIRPRDYQMLLFGADVGRQLDLYPFWHSSQKDDPGLNIAQYTNIDVDAQLESLRTATSSTERTTLLQQINTDITADTPAIFLFTPTFGYVLHESINAAIPPRLNTPSERFSTIESWHITSDRVWPIFQ